MIGFGVGLIVGIAWAQEGGGAGEVAAATAGGGGATVSFSDDFEIRYYREPQRLPAFPERPVFNYVEQVNRLTGRVSAGSHALYLQVDEVVLGANRYVLDGVTVHERELVSDTLWSPYPDFVYANVEKIAYTRELDVGAVVLGDTYAAFGRGIAINVNRNVDIDIDTSIQGAKTTVRPGAWDITALAGQLNRQQVFQDNRNVELDGDYRHAVGAVEVRRYGLGPANVGVHGATYLFSDDTGFLPGFARFGEGAPDAVVYGATVEATGLLGLDWFLEADQFLYPSGRLWEGAEPGPAYAVYGSTAAYLGRTVWLLEGKRYLDAERVNAFVGDEQYKVSVPPTLEYERVITEDSQSAVNSNDIGGGRVRVDIAAVPQKFVPYLSMAVFRDNDLSLHFNRSPETILHPVFGVESLHDHVSVLLNAGYRVDRRDDPAHGADRQTHADVDVKFPLFGPFEADVTVAAERYQWGTNTFQQSDFVEVETATTINYGPDVAFTWFMDYTTNPIVDSVGNIVDPLTGTKGPLYGAAEVQLKPLSAITIKAFYGAYKAGIRCAGGQCRLLPGFNGARVSVVANF